MMRIANIEGIASKKVALWAHFSEVFRALWAHVFEVFPYTSQRCARRQAFAPMLLLASLISRSAFAVILDANGIGNSTAPAGMLANSGWQFIGMWDSGVGTPIAPRFFLSSGHANGTVGQSLLFAGGEYLTDAKFDVPGTDLRIWRVTTDLPRWAPLYEGRDEVGKNLVVMGRGTQRGAAITLGGTLKGWGWGTADYVLRWGTNTVSAVTVGGAGEGELLKADFNHIGGNEATLSMFDSGGPVFIYDSTSARWELAGINVDVTGPFYPTSTGGAAINGALFDTQGFYLNPATNTYVAATGPSSFYATRVSSHLDFINATVPEPAVASGLIFGACCLICNRRRLSKAASR